MQKFNISSYANLYKLNKQVFQVLLFHYKCMHTAHISAVMFSNQVQSSLKMQSHGNKCGDAYKYSFNQVISGIVCLHHVFLFN